MQITIISNIYQRVIFQENRYNCEWEELIEAILTTPHVETMRKEDRQLLIPAQFVEGSAVSRNAQHLECWHMLPIDIDGGMTIYDACERYAKFEHVGYTSHNHMHDGITQKFRIFMRLKTPLPGDTFLKLDTSDFLDGADQSTLSRTRAFYLPSCPPDRLGYAQRWHNPGRPLDPWEEFDEKPVYKPIPSNLSIDVNRNALLVKLRNTTIDSYNDWWKLPSAMLNAGFSLDEFLYVTCENPLHASESHPIKTKEFCIQRWEYAQRWNAANDGGIDRRWLWKLAGIKRFSSKPIPRLKRPL